MTETMRAVVLDAPGPPEALTIRELPIPTPEACGCPKLGRAFVFNASEQRLA